MAENGPSHHRTEPEGGRSSVSTISPRLGPTVFLETHENVLISFEMKRRKVTFRSKTMLLQYPCIHLHTNTVVTFLNILFQWK